MTVFVGFDWGETRHAVEVLDADGHSLARFSITDTPDGVGRFHAVVADHADDPAEVIVGSETDRGLVIGVMMAAGYQVYAVNPKATDRYRDRHGVSGAKSDRGDAKVLADMVRTDRHNLRVARPSSELAQAVKVLARAHQSLIWARQRHVNQLRAGLREFYPQSLDAFGTDLSHKDAVAVLAAAPSPGKGRGLGRKRIETLLTKGGRQRNISWRAGQIHHALTSPALETSTIVAAARAATTTALIGLIAELNRQIDALETELESSFDQHPDTAIILSLPGIGTILGARLLAEFGDDPNRYADAKARRNYAATSPITRASGKTHQVSARWIKNPHLADTVDRWAISSLTADPWARRFYDEQIANGKTKPQALKSLSNRLVGILHGCLRHRQTYNPHIAWSRYQPAA